MDLDQTIIDTISQQFTPEEVPLVINELASLKTTYEQQKNTTCTTHIRLF